MPQLPSGREVGVSRQHILEPGTQWFACPEGHFWFSTPDLAINAPPFQRDQQVVCDFVHAPVPASIEEMERYIEVIEIHRPNGFVRTGFTLDRADRPSDWTEADWIALQQWRRSDGIREFVRESIDYCRAQAEANRSSPGHVTLRQESTEIDPSVRAARSRVAAFGRELLALEAEIGPGFRPEELERAERIFARLCEIKRAIEGMLDEPGAAEAGGWHVFGMVLRLLKAPDEAERAFLEAVRLQPFSQPAWFELTRIRGERGDHAGAEVAARRAVAIDARSAAAWANLASSLLMLGRLDEARESAVRSVALDPSDVVARNVLRLLDRSSPQGRHDGGSA